MQFRVLWLLEGPSGPVKVATYPATHDEPLPVLLRSLAARLEAHTRPAGRIYGVHVEADATAREQEEAHP